MAWALILTVGAALLLQEKAPAPRGQSWAQAARQAKPPAAKSQPWPISSLTVAGNADYSAQQILAAAGLKVGQRVTVKDFEAARDRLGATGAFEKISFKYGPAQDNKGYAVTFEVFEAGPFFPVRFEDLPAKAGELRTVLERADPLFGEKIPATEQILNRYVKALETHLSVQGYKEKLAGRVLSTDSGETAVVFLPAAPPPAVALVRFTGNEVLPTSALVNAISGVAVGMPYKEARFRQFLDTNLRPLYEARGRLRVAFPEIQTAPAKDVKGLTVTVRVEEGASYKLGKVRAESPVMAADELERIADLRSGDVADFTLVQAAVTRLEQRHRREGYMRAAARVERALDDPRRSVDLVIKVEPGPQYLMGSLTIEGLDIHGEDAVRKLWALKEGQRFNADYPDHFLEQIREQGVFDNLGKTKPVLNQDDEARRVEVKLIFTAPEKPRKPREPNQAGRSSR